MFSRGRLLISACTRSAIVLVAVAGARPIRAQQAALPGPVPAVLALQGQDAANPPPAAAALVVEALQGGQPTLADLVEKNHQEYQALLISELQFCRNACDLTDDQSQQIARRSGPIVKGAAAWAAKLELKPAQRGGIRLATDPAPPNPIKFTRDIVLKIVKENTTPAQQGRYQVELERRAAHQRQAAIQYLVARLDRILILSTDQRARLLQLFEKNWDDEWGAIVSIMDDDGASFPAIPHRLILPLLSPTQQEIWKRCEQLAIDATDIYMSTVCDFIADLPSDFGPWLSAGGVEAPQPPKEREAREKQQGKPNPVAP